jgi:hypothetical protein
MNIRHFPLSIALVSLAAAGFVEATSVHAEEAEGTVTWAKLARLDVKIVVDGSHVTVTSSPINTSLTVTAFVDDKQPGVALAIQRDGSWMATLSKAPPKSMAVVLSVKDHYDKLQEICVAALDRDAICKIEDRMLHVHSRDGHVIAIERRPAATK